jgi:hypothetical protein
MIYTKLIFFTDTGILNRDIDNVYSIQARETQ